MELKEAQKVGLKRVMIDCSVDDIGFNKTIKALGGVFERCEIDPSDNIKTNVYLINANDSLENYKIIYEQYISKK